MVFEDFRPSDEFPFEASAEIWGERADIFADLDNSEEYASALRGYINPVNAKLKWLDENREAVVKCIIDAGMISMAEHRISNMEEQNGFTLPVDEEYFANSLHIDEIIACCDEGPSNVTLDCYFVCEPDFFSGQRIEVFVNPDLSLYCNSVV